mmetsp:Transcript_26293/g.47112  ORF Transcript_26293/g.47112 Transcript_26293/m.47112 type:complete len:143 (+) Transcript_26293:3568-3996(+)
MECQSETFLLVPGLLELLEGLAVPSELTKPSTISCNFNARDFYQDDEEVSQDICGYLVEGRCSFGKDCWNYHPPQAAPECLRCTQVPSKYALLHGCPHPYCFECALSRSSLKQICPICSNSKLFVPSSLFISDPCSFRVQLP